MTANACWLALVALTGWAFLGVKVAEFAIPNPSQHQKLGNDNVTVPVTIFGEWGKTHKRRWGSTQIIICGRLQQDRDEELIRPEVIRGKKWNTVRLMS